MLFTWSQLKTINVPITPFLIKMTKRAETSSTHHCMPCEWVGRANMCQGKQGGHPSGSVAVEGFNQVHSKRSISRPWNIPAVPKVGVLWHPGLEASQRQTEGISRALWDAISISSLADPSSWHMYRKEKCPPEKEAEIQRVSEESSCKGKGSPAHSVRTDSRGC